MIQIIAWHFLELDMWECESQASGKWRNKLTSITEHVRLVKSKCFKNLVN